MGDKLYSYSLTIQTNVVTDCPPDHPELREQVRDAFVDSVSTDGIPSECLQIELRDVIDGAATDPIRRAVAAIVNNCSSRSLDDTEDREAVIDALLDGLPTIWMAYVKGRIRT